MAVGILANSSSLTDNDRLCGRHGSDRPGRPAIRPRGSQFLQCWWHTYWRRADSAQEFCGIQRKMRETRRVRQMAPETLAGIGCGLRLYGCSKQFIRMKPGVAPGAVGQRLIRRPATPLEGLGLAGLLLVHPEFFWPAGLQSADSQELGPFCMDGHQGVDPQLVRVQPSTKIQVQMLHIRQCMVPASTTREARKEAHFRAARDR